MRPGGNGDGGGGGGVEPGEGGMAGFQCGGNPPPWTTWSSG